MPVPESRVPPRDSPLHSKCVLATGHVPIAHRGWVFDISHLVRTIAGTGAGVTGGHIAVAHRGLAFDVSHLVRAAVALATGEDERKNGEAQHGQCGFQCCFHVVGFCLLFEALAKPLRVGGLF